MPVQYTDDSAGPSTRRANGEDWGGDGGSGFAAKSSSSMSKEELKELAEERGLPTSGTKDDLISRLAGVER